MRPQEDSEFRIVARWQVVRTSRVRRMNVIYLLLFLASAICFALAALAPKVVGNRVGLVPLGLLLFVLVFLIQQLQAV